MGIKFVIVCLQLDRCEGCVMIICYSKRKGRQHVPCRRNFSPLFHKNPNLVCAILQFRVCNLVYVQVRDVPKNTLSHFQKRDWKSDFRFFFLWV